MKPSSQSPRKHSGLSDSCVFLFATCLFLSGISSAAPSITLSKKSGPPTTRILVSGRGFEPNVGVDIYFGTQDEALVMTDALGSFSGIAVVASASALPGTHWLSAVERFGKTGAQREFEVRTNWSEFHRPGMRRRNPYEKIIDVHNVGKLTLKWKYTGGGCCMFASPAVVDGVVYAASADVGVGYVYALDVRNGAPKWTYITGDWVESSPAVVNGVVYVGSYDGNVYALNARTGARLWNFFVNVWVTPSPTVADGVVYVGTSGVPSTSWYVYALDARTGAELWSFLADGQTPSSPAVVDGVVYVASNSGTFYALDAHTGAQLWSYAMGGNDFGLASSPAVANGVIYVGSANSYSKVYALNAKTGALLWSYPTNGWTYSSPAVADGAVYIGSDDNNVYALDAQSGTLLWKYATGNYVISSPAVANGVVYIGSNDETLYALNARTGAKLWSWAGNGEIDSSPTVADGVIYIGGGYSDPTVYAFSLKHESAQTEPIFDRPDLKTLRPDFSLKVSQPIEP